jgi:hypothetical protein
MQAKDRIESELPHGLGSQDWEKGLLNHFDAAERDSATPTTKPSGVIFRFSRKLNGAQDVNVALRPGKRSGRDAK